MQFVPWLFLGWTLFAFWKMTRASNRLQHLLLPNGESPYMKPEHLAAPWLWFRDFPKLMREGSDRIYREKTGEAEIARRSYLGWRWTFLSAFIAFFITAAIFWH